MNPFVINKILKTSQEKLCIDSLSKKCEIPLRHRFFKMSSDLFKCPMCEDNRHYVKKISLYGWAHLPFYNIDRINF